MEPLPGKLDADVSDACIDKLRNELLHALNLDNGLEFQNMKTLHSLLGLKSGVFYLSIDFWFD